MTTPHCQSHKLAQAIAYCSQCEKPICGGCHHVDMRGFAVCYTCIGDHQQEVLPWETPQDSNLEAFFRTTWTIFFENKEVLFFQFPSHGKNINPALFGFLCTNIGAVFFLVWSFLFVEGFDNQIYRFLSPSVPISYARSFVFLAVPVLSVFSFALQAILWHCFAHVFGMKFTQKQTLNMVGYASVAHLLHILPLAAFTPAWQGVLWIFFIWYYSEGIKFYSKFGYWGSYALAFFFVYCSSIATFMPYGGF